MLEEPFETDIADDGLAAGRPLAQPAADAGRVYPRRRLAHAASCLRRFT